MWYWRATTDWVCDAALARYDRLGLLEGAGPLVLFGSTYSTWPALLCWIYYRELARFVTLGLLSRTGPLS